MRRFSKGFRRSVDSGCVSRASSREITNIPGAETLLTVEGNTDPGVIASQGGPGAVQDPERAHKRPTWETGDPVIDLGERCSEVRAVESRKGIQR